MAGTVKILVLGSGMVAPPCVEFLVRQPTNLVTVGTPSLAVSRRRLLLRSRLTPLFSQPYRKGAGVCLSKNHASGP